MEAAYAAYIQRIRGCGIIDSGATKGCMSANAFNQIQHDRIDWGEGRLPELTASDVTFKFAGAGQGQSDWMATIPVEEGILAGRSVEFHVCNIDGDETLGLI